MSVDEIGAEFQYELARRLFRATREAGARKDMEDLIDLLNEIGPLSRESDFLG